MAISQVHTCDGCGKQKGETNHWYLVACHDFSNKIEILAWSNEASKLQDLNHICGMECLIKLISQEAPNLKAGA